MIHEILSSDVDFARSLMDSGHSDAEILTQLVSRGLETAKAATLLDDLRHGRKPSTQLLLAPGSDGYRHPHKPRAATTTASQKPDLPRHHSHRWRHRRSAVPWWFALLVVIFIGALAYALWMMGTHVTQDAVDQDRHEIPAPPTK